MSTGRLAPWAYEPAAPGPRLFTGSPVSSLRESEEEREEPSSDEVGSPEIYTSA